MRVECQSAAERENPPRHGEGDRAAVEGAGGWALRKWRPPSTILRMVPLPVPGRIFGGGVQRLSGLHFLAADQRGRAGQADAQGEYCGL